MLFPPNLEKACAAEGERAYYALGAFMSKHEEAYRAFPHHRYMRLKHQAPEEAQKLMEGYNARLEARSVEGEEEETEGSETEDDEEEVTEE